jgi:hypothetical protein
VPTIPSFPLTDQNFPAAMFWLAVLIFAVIVGAAAVKYILKG